MGAPQLPEPVVTSEMFLYAIVYELRRMNDLLAQLIPVQPATKETPIEPVTDVELKEPEQTPVRKGRKAKQ